MSRSDRSKRLEYTKVLIAEADEGLAKLKSPTRVLDHMRKSAIADLRKELVDLGEVLGTTHHRLVFIGKVGIGKTTAIRHLIGLTAERSRKRPSKTDPERTIRVTEDLMATGSGFTTLCEVVVKPSDTNKFEINPYLRQEVERTIDDFCTTTWAKVNPEAAEVSLKATGSETPAFPSELARAVRNMVRLPSGDRKEDDAAIKLAREFKPDQFDKFRDKVVGLAHLEKRNQTVFQCPADEPDPRAWIKQTFDDLNLARLETATIPRQITLHVDKQLLLPNARGYEAIVDTRGVDAAQFNREDLDKYIREDKSALCILMEGFRTVPTDVMPLLSRHVTPETPLALSKLVLLVVPRGSEPENTQAEDGPIGDRDRGVEYRRRQVEETLGGRGIKEMNVLFYDPLQHFFDAKEGHCLQDDSEPADLLSDQDRIWNGLEAAIGEREDQVWQRIERIGDSLTKIRQGKGLKPSEEALVKNTRGKVAEYRQVPFTSAERFWGEYKGLWLRSGGRPASSLRATNNRFGVYDSKDINIYYNAVPITEMLVRRAYSGSKEAVVEIIRAVRTSAAEASELGTLLGVLETRIDSSFEAMVRGVATHMQGYLAGTVFAPRDINNRFWGEVIARYGQGPGYRDDVLGKYESQLEGHETELRRVGLGQWQKLVIDPALEYLG